jgi:hypothetical protein
MIKQLCFALFFVFSISAYSAPDSCKEAGPVRQLIFCHADALARLDANLNKSSSMKHSTKPISDF